MEDKYKGNQNTFQKNFVLIHRFNSWFISNGTLASIAVNLWSWDRSAFLDKQVSSVNQLISTSLQPPNNFSISTTTTHTTASITKEVRSICCAVSSTASICNTTSGRSLDVLNKTKGMACYVHHNMKSNSKENILMECMNLICNFTYVFIKSFAWTIAM